MGCERHVFSGACKHVCVELLRVLKKAGTIARCGGRRAAQDEQRGCRERQTGGSQYHSPCHKSSFLIVFRSLPIFDVPRRLCKRGDALRIGCPTLYTHPAVPSTSGGEVEPLQ